MAHYNYTARSKNGEKVSGSMVASSKAAAIKEVERMGLFPVTIDPDHASASDARSSRVMPKPAAQGKWGQVYFYKFRPPDLLSRKYLVHGAVTLLN